MNAQTEAFGRTIQLFLVDGAPNGLTIASIHGWTGSVLVATQSTFGRLLARPEVDRTGIYILFGPDPTNALQMRAYIGEADSVRDRIRQSAAQRDFWEVALVITTSDEALTKGHVRYLEARLIMMATEAARVALDNGQLPASERRRLPEADRANMEAFLANLKVILPVVGLDLLKPQPRALSKAPTVSTSPQIENAAAQASVLVDATPQFEIRHKSGVRALAEEQDGEFIVLPGSDARKDPGSVGHSYLELKEELVSAGVLIPSPDGKAYKFSKAYAFRSPSAAATIVLDRSSNGRTEWKVPGSGQTYHAWQVANANVETGSHALSESE